MNSAQAFRSVCRAAARPSWPQPSSTLKVSRGLPASWAASYCTAARCATRGPSPAARGAPRWDQRRLASSLPESGGSERFKNKSAMGPFSVPSAILFLITGGGLLWYFQSEKEKVDARKRAETASAKVGRPRIGGPFELVAASTDPATGQPTGAKITHEDLQGAFSLIYFGFTNCPDICPEELDKMGTVVDEVAKVHGPVVQPVFVSCDPARDTLAATAKYVADFHPSLLGLTGSYEAVKAACKAYRVYFSTPPGADPTGDYLVDHSIFFYLMDPEGRFVEAFGRSVGPEETSEKVKAFVKQWKDAGNSVGTADAKAKIFADPSRRVESEKQ